MKKLIALFSLIILSVTLLSQKPAKTTDSFNSVNDIMNSFLPSSIKVEGYLGNKMGLVISQRIKTQDPDYLIEPFRHKDETSLWQSEFWGKWVLSAIAAYDYKHDPELLELIENSVQLLLKTQQPDGYIGNYSVSAQLHEWDIWGRKYTLLGLLAFYDLTGDKSTLKGACRLADHLLSQVGPGKADIVKTGNYRGMPSCSILEPVVYLYRRTGEKKYLDFAKYIVSQWETADGPKLVSKALQGVPVAERFPHPDVWWSWDNGQKAYEMMSCYDGLLELYKITGEPDYLKAVEMAAENIIGSEINLAGSGTAFECFYNGSKYQTEPTYHTMETCVTMTWMKLCFDLLRLTGNPVYADQIEKSTYNALLASVKYDGSQIAKYSPLGGLRHAGENQCGMHINCCSANGPRAFMMLPRFAVMGGKNIIYVNLYGDVNSTVPVNSNNEVNIIQRTDYPVSDKIEFDITPASSENFTIAFRIPSWSAKSSVLVNGIDQPMATPGTYMEINRLWNKGDKVILTLDLSGRVVNLNGQQAIVRGPVVLARDSRFKDGYLNEAAVISEKNGYVELIKSDNPENIWMSFTAPLTLGTDLEGDFRTPRQIHFCDFASAGNTWSEDSRYSVWIPHTLNVMNKDYIPY